MANPLHKFYCVRCGLQLYGADAADLACNVNHHAKVWHPSDSSSWTADLIQRSKHYSTSPSQVLASYTVPYGTTSRSGSVLPALSEFDKKLLEEAHIRW